MYTEIQIRKIFRQNRTRKTTVAKIDQRARSIWPRKRDHLCCNHCRRHQLDTNRSPTYRRRPLRLDEDV